MPTALPEHALSSLYVSSFLLRVVELSSALQGGGSRAVAGQGAAQCLLRSRLELALSRPHAFKPSPGWTEEEDKQGTQEEGAGQQRASHDVCSRVWPHYIVSLLIQ